MHTCAAMVERAKAQERVRLKNLERLRSDVANHVGTTTLSIEHLPKPYAFVMERYPEVADIIAKIKILKNDNTALWKRWDLSGAAGLYIRPFSLVFIMYSPKAPDDVVAVHELLHCAHDKLLLAKETIAQENMTFRVSIPYLKRTYDDKWIVDNYMFPFYYSLARPSFEEKTAAVQMMLLNIEEETRQKCLRIIAEEMGTAHSSSQETSAPDRFDFLD